MKAEPVVLPAHERHAQAVAFSPGGDWLVSVGMDALVRLFEVPGFEPGATLRGHQQSVNSVAFAPDGTRLATCSTDGSAAVWSFPDGELLHRLAGQRLPRWSADGRLLTTLDRGARVVHWDANDFRELSRLPALDRRVFCFAHAPRDDELLVGGTGRIHRVRLHDGAVLEVLAGHGVAVQALAISPDGGLLASTGAEGTLRLWETAAWQVVREVPLRASGVLALAWTPDSRRVAVSGDHVIQLVAASGAEAPVRLDVPIKGVYGLAWSPDGRWLANAGADGRVRLWES